MFYRLAIVLCIVSLALGSRVFAASPYLLPERPRHRKRARATATATRSQQSMATSRPWGAPPAASLSDHRRPGDLVAAASRRTCFPPFPGPRRARSWESMAAETPWAGQLLAVTSIRAASTRSIFPPATTTATILPVLNSASPYGAAYGISNNGAMAGYSTSTDAYNNMHAFVWTSAGGITDVGGLARFRQFRLCDQPQRIYLAGYAYPTSGNDAGGPGGWVPTVWTNTGSSGSALMKSEPLGVAGEAELYAVNNNGDSVGTGYRFGGAKHESGCLSLRSQRDGGLFGQPGSRHPNRHGAGDQRQRCDRRRRRRPAVAPIMPLSGLSAGGMQDLNNMLTPSAPAGWTCNMPTASTTLATSSGTGPTPSGATHAFLLTPVLPGDANLDGKVDINDLTIVLAHYNQEGAWTQGEFTGSGTVDINDLTIVLANYNATASSATAGPIAVPEPCSVAPLARPGCLLAYAWRKWK